MVIVEEIVSQEQHPQMSELMTREEIERRFPDEWIYVVDPEFDEHMRVVRGVVKSHSKDPAEVDRVAVSLRPTSSAAFFAAVTPNNEMFML